MRDMHIRARLRKEQNGSIKAIGGRFLLRGKRLKGYRAATRTDPMEETWSLSLAYRPGDNVP
jgi:hypothetical protein